MLVLPFGDCWRAAAPPGCSSGQIFRPKRNADAAFAGGGCRLLVEWLIADGAATPRLQLRLGCPRGGAQTGHDEQSVDFAVLKCGEEFVVIPDRDAAVRIAVWAQHVAMGQ